MQCCSARSKHSLQKDASRPLFMRTISQLLTPRSKSNLSDVDLHEDSLAEPTAKRDLRAFAGAEWAESCGADYAAAATAASHEGAQHMADLKALLPKLDVNKQSPKTGDTLLITASVAGNAAAASALLDGGANVNLANKQGFAPLHAAARIGSSNCVRVLLKYDADVRAELPDGRTALDLAITAQQEAAAAQLEPATAEHHNRAGAHHRPDMVVAILQQLEDEQFDRDEKQALARAEADAAASMAQAKGLVQAATEQ